MDNLVSVVIPIYNVEAYLPKCLDSVIGQTYKNLEIICVNDCSPDNSMAILKQYAEKEKRLKIVNREKNGGLSAARNSGMEVATGEYVYFLDSDDWIDPDYIEKMVTAALQSQADIVLNHAVDVGDHPRNYLLNSLNGLSDVYMPAQKAILSVLWNTWAHLWKKSFLDKIKAAFPEGYIYEDMYFQSVTFPYTDKIYVIDGGAYHYAIRDNNITAQNKSKQKHFESLMKILNAIYDVYQEKGLTQTLQARLIPNIYVLFDACNQMPENYALLRQYFLKIQQMIDRTKTLYFKSEMVIFDDVIYDRTPYPVVKYKNQYLIDSIRNGQNKRGGIDAE